MLALPLLVIVTDSAMFVVTVAMMSPSLAQEVSFITKYWCYCLLPITVRCSISSDYYPNCLFYITHNCILFMREFVEDVLFMCLFTRNHMHII